MKSTIHTVRVVLQLPGHPPLTVQSQTDDLAFNPKRTVLASVQVGIGPAYGGVTVPLDILSALMAKAMAAAEERTGGIVVPKPPAIVIPN